MADTTSLPSTSFDSIGHPILLYSTKPSGHSSDGSIANATTTSAITLGPAGEYELSIISASIAVAAPHIIYVRDSTGSAFNSMIFGVPVSGSVTRRFTTQEDGLQITLRNNNSSGTVSYGIVKVDK